MLRIIDNKKIDITDTEYKIYQKLCEEYTEKYFQGKELFIGLFEVNTEGIILFVKPQNQRKFSMEIYCFMLSVMQNQHLRIMQKQQQMFIEEAQKKHIELFKNTNERISKLDNYLELLELLNKVKDLTKDPKAKEALSKLKNISDILKNLPIIEEVKDLYIGNDESAEG
jgi:hypothetical protein